MFYRWSVVPTRGAAGIWGPSCLATARLVEDDSTRCSGIAGRPCELMVADASDESGDAERTVTALVHHNEVNALVGMCTQQTRVGKDFLDHPLFQGGGDKSQFAARLPAASNGNSLTADSHEWRQSGHPTRLSAAWR